MLPSGPIIKQGRAGPFPRNSLPPGVGGTGRDEFSSWPPCRARSTSRTDTSSLAPRAPQARPVRDGRRAWGGEGGAGFGGAGDGVDYRMSDAERGQFTCAKWWPSGVV